MEKIKRGKREDREQLDIWEDKDKCSRLQEYWGDYDLVAEDPLRKNFVLTVLKLIKLTAGKLTTLLEVGCGTGHNLWVWRNSAKLFGLEHSHEMVKLVKEKFEGYDLEVVQGDCWKMPYKDNVFDISVQMDVCLHIGGSWESILEMLRVTKKYVVFTGPSFENYKDVMSKKVKGKLTWGISVPLLEKELNQRRKEGKIKNYYYIHRPPHGKEKAGKIKHRILVIEKGDKV